MVIGTRVKIIKSFTKGYVTGVLGRNITVKLDNGKTWVGKTYQVLILN